MTGAAGLFADIEPRLLAWCPDARPWAQLFGGRIYDAGGRGTLIRQRRRAGREGNLPPHGTFRCGASSHRPAARQDGLASRVPDRGETHFKTALSLEGVVTVQRNLAKRGQLGALPASDNYTNFDVGCEVSAAAKEALAVGERGAESTTPRPSCFPPRRRRRPRRAQWLWRSCRRRAPATRRGPVRRSRRGGARAT